MKTIEEKQGKENPLKSTLGDVFDDLKFGLDPSPKQGEQKPIIVRFKIGDVIKDISCGKTYTIIRYIKNGIAFVDNKGEEFTKYYDEDDWDAYELIEQKPADSIPEDFEKYIEHLLSLSDGEGHGSPAKVKEVSAELFKLAKLEQKLAWSEEDEKMLEAVLYDGENALGERHKEWLKSLKDKCVPQPHWKPSEEQMEALKLSTYCQDKKMSKILFELYKQLEAL